MRFLIIIPAHNEEETLPHCLYSLVQQNYKNFKVVVVDDGSTDGTKEIINDFTNQFIQSKAVFLDVSEHQPGSKVVRAFEQGLKAENPDAYNVICKFDADIIFPKDYLEKLNDVYENNPKAGMVSGLVRISDQDFDQKKAFDFLETDESWKFEDISSKNHVRGPIKSYRLKCLKDMNGLKPVLGWDNIDVMLAKKYDWEVITIKNLWVKHLRPTAEKYKGQKAEKLGEYFYNIGLNLPLATISAAKSAMKSKKWLSFFTTMKSFLKQKGKRQLSDEEIQFVRQSRWNEMKDKI